VHWWHLFWRIVPEARQALDQVAMFLEQLWASQRPAPAAGVLAQRPGARRRATYNNRDL